MTDTSILVVDDNLDLCDTLKDILEMENYAVTLAHGGEQAVELVRTARFGRVLMDIRMPGINGVDAFKEMKKISPDTPVIMMTAFAVEDLINEALREGAFAALQKPLDFDVLLDTIMNTGRDAPSVLVVDDEPGFRETLKFILEERGCTVRLAAGGEDAIRAAKQMRFDAAVIDLNMPMVDGIEAYRAIRAFRPGISIIAVSAQPDVGKDTFTGGRDDESICFMEKPINMDDLVEALERSLSRDRIN